MLRLLQSIFTQIPETPSKYDDELIEKAIERVVAGTDPRLRAISDYRKQLRLAVIKAVDYTVELTKKDVFDFFIKQALTNIIVARDRQQKEKGERAILSSKLRNLEAANWGIDAVLRGEGEKAVNVDRTEKTISNMENDLKKVDIPPLILEHYLQLIIETLNNTREHLWKTAITIKLDHMDIKIEKETANAPITLNLEEYQSSENRSAIALLVCIPFDQIPDNSDLLAKASRYL